MTDRLQVSPITLGTVQLGFRYGVANRVGQPDIDDSYRILARALTCGAITWDTARHYGTAEEVIGGFLKSSTPDPAPLVVTKFKWDSKAFADKKAALAQAKERILASLTCLGMKKLPMVLFHQDKDQPTKDVMRLLPDVLHAMKEDGLIGCAGISLYFADEAKYVVDEPIIEAIQAPLNVMDQRLIRNGALRNFYLEQKTVFIRSVYLQGLFFLEENNLPKSLSGIVPYLRQLKGLASEARMDVAQFAFSYVRDTIGVSSVIFGAETAAQVEQNASMLLGPSIPEEIRAKARTLFDGIPERLITPGCW